MDRLRRLTKSKSLDKNDQGNQHVRQEKSKSKLRSSSLVARFMGFDSLKFKQPIHRQHKSFVENNLHQTSPVAPQGDPHLVDGGSHKKRFNEQSEYKDIFEDNQLFVKHLQDVQESSYIPASTQNRPKSSKIGVEEKDNSRIVILKPDYTMAQDPRHCFSSNDPFGASISRSRKCKGKMSDPTNEEDFLETSDFVDALSFSASQVRETKASGEKVVKEFREPTQIMKEIESEEAAKRFSKELQEVFSRIRTDFPSYIKEIHGTGGLHDLSGIDSASESEVIKMTSFDSTESFISRLAKKRLLDRWRRAQRYQHTRAGGKGKTLGEMLCTPEERMNDLNAACSRGNRYRNLGEVHGNFEENEDLLSNKSTSSKRKSKSLYKRASNAYDLLEDHIICNEVDILKKGSPDEWPMVPPFPTVTASSVYPGACYQDSPRSMLNQCDSSHGAQEHPNPKFLGAEAGSSGSLKEVDPSTILALEITSEKDVSSSPQCFKQFSADLHDISKRVSLLSTESKSSCDNSPDEGSRLALDVNELVGSECWKSFYIADVLTESGLYDMDTDTLMPSSNGVNHPLGPWVFHKLETKYCDESSAPKHERMLLFDRIRSAVLEISQSCMNQCPWVKPVSAEFGLKWPICKLRNELHKLLAIQDAEVVELISGKVIEKVTFCGDLRNSVDMIGIIIERLLTKDLLMELVTELQFDV